MKKSLFTLLTTLLLISNISNAQVTVNASIVTRPVSEFYGLNGSGIFALNSCYADPDVRNGILLARPSYLRYPGGTNANYWDWQEGWMYRNLEDNGPISMDLDYQSKNRIVNVFNGMGVLNTQGGNYINDFYTTLAQTGTKPLFILNPLTSDLYYQIAMLLEAKYQNLDVQRVEIGNELYLSRPAYVEKFNSAEDYANLEITWRNQIKNYLGNSVLLSAVAANSGASGETDRIVNWNTNLINSLGVNTPDSYNIHQYRTAGISGYSNNFLDYSTIFGKVNNDFTVLKNYIDQLGGPNATTPIWMTEYNLYDKTANLPIHGTWFNALFAAYNTLKFLEIDRIAACNLHAQSGGFVFANFYNTLNGLANGGDFVTPTCIIPTVLNSRTSTGIAMDQIAIAFKGATSASKLQFGNLPSSSVLHLLSDQSSPVYGWQLLKGNNGSKDVVIMNLSDVTVSNVDLNNLGFSNTDKYTQLTINDPQAYADGNTVGGNSNQFAMVNCPSTGSLFIDKSDIILPVNGIIQLPPYSITRIYKKGFPLIPDIFAYKETINSGSSVELTTLNNLNYSVQWSTGATTSSISVNPSVTTSYSATFTSLADGSTIQKSITINVAPVPLTVSINPSSSQPFCPGSNAITLTANASGGAGANYKYVWITTPVDDDIPDNNHGLSFNQMIGVQPTIPTAYTVYVTDGNLVAKATFTVQVPTAFSLKSEYTFCKLPSNFTSEIALYTTSTSGVTFSYTWQGVTIATSNPIILSEPTVSVSDNIIINANYSGCTQSKVAKVNFFDCCNPGSRIEIPTNSNLDVVKSLALSAGFTVSSINNSLLVIDCGNNTNGNTDMIFHGDFHIADQYLSGNDFNTGLELDNCNLIFSEGASLVVEPGFTLKVDGVNMDAASCTGKLWKGIVLDAGILDAKVGSSYFKVKNSEIAINSLPGSSVTLKGVELTNNVIGLNSTLLSLNKRNLQFISVVNSKFLGLPGTSLLNPYVGQLTPVGLKPFAGINFYKVVGIIGGDLTTGKNKFSFLNSGLISSNSALYIQNSSFDNIVPDNLYINQNYGAAIHAFTYNSGYNYLNYNGLINGTGFKSIDNCKTGVETTETELEVQDATIDHVERGIIASDNILTSVKIHGNTITATESCIDLINNDNSPSVDVESNNLTASNTPVVGSAYGIRIWEGNNRNSRNRMIIHCNHIDMIYAQKGIDLMGADYVVIKENGILQHVPDIYQTAVYLSKSDFCTIKHNGINSQSTFTYVWNKGFVIENSESNTFYNNSTSNTRYGFEFTGFCNRTNFLQNIMTNGNKGLLVNEKAILDPQFDKGNTWYGTYLNNIAADNLNRIANTILLASSAFFANASQGLMYYPTVDPNLGWFNPSNNLCSNIQEIMSCHENDPVDKFSIEPSDLLTLHAIALDSIFLEESKTNAAKSLFEKFAANDSILNSSTEYLAFQDSLSQTTSGQLSLNRLSLAKENSIIENNQNLIGNYEISKLLYEYDSVRYLNQNELIDYSLLTNLNQQLFSLDSISSLLDSILSINLTQTINSAPTSVQSNIVNENERNLNIVLATHRLKGLIVFSSNEISIIQSIALQCPREGGASVYRARTLMYFINRDMQYNDDNFCNAIAARRGHIVENNKNSFYLLPDRSNDLLIITSDFEIKSRIVINVYDAIGKIIESNVVNIKGNRIEFPFHQTKTTFYLISIKDELNNQSNFKLIW